MGRDLSSTRTTDWSYYAVETEGEVNVCPHAMEELQFTCSAYVINFCVSSRRIDSLILFDPLASHQLKIYIALPKPTVRCPILGNRMGHTIGTKGCWAAEAPALIALVGIIRRRYLILPRITAAIQIGWRHSSILTVARRTCGLIRLPNLRGTSTGWTLRRINLSTCSSI